MKIYIGADHRGFDLKNDLKQWLISLGHQIEDSGANQKTPFDDYTDFAVGVANKVVAEQGSRGIVICGSGAGVDITANKIRGIRSASGFNIEQVEAARADDNINVLALASDFTFFDSAKDLVEAFLQTQYNPTDNHARRIEKIRQLE